MAKRLPSRPPVLPGLNYVRPLGSGGFADVFLYEQDMPRRAVAVKVLPASVRDPDLRRMFNAEADVLAHLSAHPSIVTVYQAGVSADGRAHIVMEYCPGSLAQRYRAERIPVAEALAIGVKMASALETAHRAGVVHRDVKPSNILTTAFGAPVLADFGISTSLASTPSSEVLAMSVPWSAPEVIAEETTGTVASEVWSVAATVYSLLAGRTPFERPGKGKNSRDQLVARIARASYTQIPRPDVPDSLQRALERAMNKEPSQRFESAIAFAQALRDIESELGYPATGLEVPVSDWVGETTAVDFADDTARAAVRSSVDYPQRRKPANSPSLAGLARDEDHTSAPTSGPRRRRNVFVLVGVALAAVLVLGALAAIVIGTGIL